MRAAGLGATDRMLIGSVGRGGDQYRGSCAASRPSLGLVQCVQDVLAARKHGSPIQIEKEIENARLTFDTKIRPEVHLKVCFLYQRML